MAKQKTKTKFRTVVRWILWILLAQFILINISAAFYAYRFTHLYTAGQRAVDLKKHVSQNIFAKTWRLFTGPRFYKLSETEVPVFPYTTVVLKTKNKIPIEAWYGRADSASKGTVILFHGLTGNKSLVLQQAYEFRYWNYNVMLVDVRGHGKSGDNITTIGYKESEEVKLAYEYIKKGGEENIYLWGASMGSVEIIKAVTDYNLKPEGIILEMPFLSLQSHLKGRAKIMGFPKQPFAFLITFWIGAEQGFNGFGFNTASYAKKITCPVLIQYGTKDQLVKKNEVEDIYDAFASADKKLVIYDGATHEYFLKKNPERWRKEVEEFLIRTR